MKSHTRAMQRWTAVVLTVLLAVTAIFSQTMIASASDDNVYVKQMGSGYCTLASATMMLRSKGKIEGMSSWTSITQQSLKSTAWISGAGLRHSFTYAGMSVSYGNFTESDIKSTLIAMLKKHPEGVEIYERALPHAILLTRYDSGTDTFYCADPALSASERTLASSYLRHVSSSSTTAGVQQDIIDGLDSYWYISKYNSEASAAYDSSDLNSGTSDSSSTDTSSDSSTSTDTSDSSSSTDTSSDSSTSTDTSDSTATSDDSTDTSTDTSNENTGVLDDSSVSTDTTDEIVDSSSSDSGVISDGENVITEDSDAVKVKFDKTRDFSTVSFSDVETADWFYSAVQSAYEMALMTGISDTEFGVDGDVTIAQSVTIAARIYAQIEAFTGVEMPDFTPASGEAWYTPYADYAYEKGIIGTKYYTLTQVEPDRAATRAEFAEILSEALPSAALSAINYVASGSIPDVDENTSAGEAIYMLYRAGVLAGSTDGLYHPDSTVTRSEVAAIVSRMADYTQRIAL
ncbi:MAG: S-layer homology domain-containing protein [Anaerovoracaceae bacterium]|jgi:hypothetical protein